MMAVIADPNSELLRSVPKWTTERVTSIRYWTPTLLSFRTTRYQGFRFTPGHYARLGLGTDDDRVWRPYSLASATYHDYLEFIATLVPDGAFSERLGKLTVGDEISIEKLCYGFLTTGQLAPGRDLWMLATGTGIGPFISILHDSATWQSWERLIVVHSVRHAAELAYREEIAALPKSPLLAGEKASLTYLPIVTRDPEVTTFTERMPILLGDGRLEQAANVPLAVATSRLMVCGNPEMARDIRQLLSSRGFATGRRGALGQMVFEKYW